MWQLRQPSAQEIAAFLERQKQQNFSYPEVGASRGAPPKGYDIDHNRISLGQGRAVFTAACRAVQGWQMFPRSWARIEPPRVPIAVGNTLAMVAHVYGLWWLNACRIVYVLDEETPVRRYGFAYGTLPDHVERGEECFSVEWLPDDTVWYDIRAFSHPRYWAVRLAYPLARRLQRRFVRDSQAVMRQAVKLYISMEAES